MSRDQLVPPDPDRLTALIDQILNLNDILTLPDPEPLIADWLDLRTAVMVIGNTGTNKTFTMLGMACSIATGVPWLGHEVKIEPAGVLLVIGEGSDGIKARTKAWIEENGVTPEHLFMWRKPPRINEAEFWEDLAEIAKALLVRAVFFDTLSSLAYGMDEVREAASIVRWMSDLADAINGTVVMAHHTPLSNSGRARGGTQFEDDADAVITLRRFEPSSPAEDDPNLPVQIRRKKAKEGREGYTVWARRKDVADSCVLESVGEPASLASRRKDPVWEHRAAIDQVLRDMPDQLTATEVVEKVGGRKTDVRKLLKDRIAAGEIPEVETRFARANGRSYTKKVLGAPRNPAVNLSALRAEIEGRGGD